MLAASLQALFQHLQHGLAPSQAQQALAQVSARLHTIQVVGNGIRQLDGPFQRRPRLPQPTKTQQSQADTARPHQAHLRDRLSGRPRTRSSPTASAWCALP